MQTLWTDAYLEQIVGDGIYDIVDKVDCIFHRFFLQTFENTSLYTLPDYVKGIRRVTWRGVKLEAVSWLEMELLTRQTAVLNSSTSFEVSSGRPQFYALHPSNIRNIQFYPRPSESFDATGDPFSPTVFEPKCTISCFRTPVEGSDKFDLPRYIARRTVKAYTLWKAFGKEGKGQDLTASAYYAKKYQFLISQFSSINNQVFMAKRRELGSDNDSSDRSRRPAKPTLPANFERTIYR